MTAHSKYITFGGDFGGGLGHSCWWSTLRADFCMHDTHAKELQATLWRRSGCRCPASHCAEASARIRLCSKGYGRTWHLVWRQSWNHCSSYRRQRAFSFVKTNARLPKAWGTCFWIVFDKVLASRRRLHTDVEADECAIQYWEAAQGQRSCGRKTTMTRH